MRTICNPFFWVGLGILMVGISLIFFGDPPSVLSLMSSDGRCTGFPNGIGQWQWGDCCKVHDNGGTDVELVSCIIERVPKWATPLCFLGVAIMGFGRPGYNLLQRWGIVK